MAYDCKTIFQKSDETIVHTLPMLYEPLPKQDSIILNVSNEYAFGDFKNQKILYIDKVLPDVIIPEKFQILRTIIVS